MQYGIYFIVVNPHLRVFVQELASIQPVRTLLSAQKPPQHLVRRAAATLATLGPATEVGVVDRDPAGELVHHDELRWQL